MPHRRVHAGTAALLRQTKSDLHGLRGSIAGGAKREREEQFLWTQLYKRVSYMELRYEDVSTTLR